MIAVYYEYAILNLFFYFVVLVRRKAMEHSQSLARKILVVLVKVIIVVFAVMGAYKTFIDIQFSSTKRRVEAIESKRNYDPDLLYYKDGGEPLVLVNPEYKTTLFFMEGFRTQSPAGMYESYFRELFTKYKVNVIVPIYGIQSSPFSYRNRDWRFQEDMRLVLQVYTAYTAALPSDHWVVTCSQSFGTLPHAAIGAFAKRKPDAMIFLSPHNTGLDFKASGPFVHWLSKQTSWLQYVVLFSMATPAPGRASVWDIVNTEKNLAMAARNDTNPEDASRYGYINEKVAAYIETRLLPKLNGMNCTVICGDSDLYFSQSGFDHFAEILRNAGATVSFTRIPNSGHMVLLDNGEETVKAIIASVLRLK